jgi:hypothetical protein
VKRGSTLLAVVLLAGCGGGSSKTSSTTTTTAAPAQSRGALIGKVSHAFIAVSQLCVSVPPTGKPTAASLHGVAAAVNDYAAAYRTLGKQRFAFAPGAPKTDMRTLIAEGSQALAPCDAHDSAALQQITQGA